MQVQRSVSNRKKIKKETWSNSVENINFFESSKLIVQNFLNNVITVDDQLSFGPSEVKIEAIESFEDFDLAANDSGLGVVAAPVVQAAPQLHPLDYQELSISFSNKGINCCAYRPDINRDKNLDTAAERIMQSSKNTDITILDWQMDDKFVDENGISQADGSLAISSIRKILSHDKLQHGRLRLIIIYTGVPDLNPISDKIHQALLSDGYKASSIDNNIKFDNDELKFCHIQVIEKQENADKLTEQAIDLFTKLTIGLLSNATLSAISALRNKTHHILHTFNKNLDPAYFSHILGLMSSPKVRENAHEIAFDYAAELISEEIKSIIQINNPIKHCLEKERIDSWIDYIREEETDFFKIKVGDNPTVDISPVRVKKLLNATTTPQIKAILLEEPAIIPTQSKPQDVYETHRIEFKVKGWGDDCHEQLSIIECKRRDGLSLNNEPYEPNIKLGSIIKDVNESYYVCLQPLCDSVRLKSPTGFIFLKAEVVIAEKGKFTHVIRTKQGEKIKLIIRPKATNIFKFILKPDLSTKTVKCIQIENNYLIEYQNENNEIEDLTWLGELKNNVAQAIANNLASNISRVGLDTNEWLRLSS